MIGLSKDQIRTDGRESYTNKDARQLDKQRRKTARPIQRGQPDKLGQDKQTTKTTPEEPKTTQFEEITNPATLAANKARTTLEAPSDELAFSHTDSHFSDDDNDVMGRSFPTPRQVGRCEEESSASQEIEF